MANYLTNNEIHELTDAVLAAALVTSDSRDDLLAGINAGFVAGLPHRRTDLDQIHSDLARLNETPYLIGGEVPLRIWLENAVHRTRLSARPQQHLFQQILNKVAVTSQEKLAATGGPSGVIQEPDLLENIIHEDDLLRFSWLQGALAVGNSVVRLVTPRIENGQARRSPGGDSLGSKGTGWLIGPRYVITNHHVINARSESESDAAESDLRLQAERTVVEFAYDYAGASVESIEVETLAAWSPRNAAPPLDYAILKLRQPALRTPLTLAPKALMQISANKLPVNIIQHPGGNPKMIGVRNNQAASLEQWELRYFTDTMQGSSGSPVCNDDWHVIALHRATLGLNPHVQYQGKDTAWVNQGVRIDRLIDHLKLKHPQLWADIEATVL